MERSKTWKEAHKHGKEHNHKIQTYPCPRRLGQQQQSNKYVINQSQYVKNEIIITKFSRHCEEVIHLLIYSINTFIIKFLPCARQRDRSWKYGGEDNGHSPLSRERYYTNNYTSNHRITIVKNPRSYLKTKNRVSI